MTFQKKNMSSIWIPLTRAIEVAPPTACLIVPFIATTITGDLAILAAVGSPPRDRREFLAQIPQHIQCRGSTAAASMYTPLSYPFVFVFFPCEQAKPSCLFILLFVCAGEIEFNPGPVYTICKVRLSRRDGSVFCGECNQWIHIRCSGLQSVKDYIDPDTTCHSQCGRSAATA